MTPADFADWPRDRLIAEIIRLHATAMSLANRLAACSECLGKAAERGKVVVTPEQLTVQKQEM